MDQMMKKIANYPNGTSFTVFYNKEKLIIQGSIDTIYESDNCLDEDDPQYKEFYACAFRIEKIINKPSSFEKMEGDLIEISIENQPSLIVLLDGNVVWKQEDIE